MSGHYPPTTYAPEELPEELRAVVTAAVGVARGSGGGRLSATDEYPELRDLNCAVCERPLTEILEAIIATGGARPMPVLISPHGTARLVCGACAPELLGEEPVIEIE